MKLKKVIIFLGLVLITTTCLVFLWNSPTLRFNRALKKIKSVGWEVEERNYGVFFIDTFIEVMQENPDATLNIMEIDNLESFLDYARKFLADKIYYDKIERLFFCFAPVSKTILKLYW